MKITLIQIRQEPQCLPEYMPTLKPYQNTVYLGDQHCVCRWPGIHGGRTSTGTMKITLIQIRQEPQCLPEYMPTLRPYQNTVYLGDQHCVCRWPGIHGGRTSTGTMKITLIQIRQEPQCLPEYMPILTPNVCAFHRTLKFSMKIFFWPAMRDNITALTLYEYQASAFGGTMHSQIKQIAV